MVVKNRARGHLTRSNQSNYFEFEQNNSQVTKEPSADVSNPASKANRRTILSDQRNFLVQEESTVLSDTLGMYRKSYAELLEKDPEARTRHVREQPHSTDPGSPARSDTRKSRLKNEKMWTDMYDGLEDSLLFSREAKIRGKSEDLKTSLVVA